MKRLFAIISAILVSGFEPCIWCVRVGCLVDSIQ